MKFVSLFTKAPNYKRFSYNPRFYDQKAEERKEREERIRREIEMERGELNGDAAGYRSRMTGSFQSARKRSNKSQESLRSMLIRSGVLLFLTLFIMAFLTWGRVALYSLLLFVPVYFYLKFKK
ncbi:MAG TPA: hypothetical protein PLR06_01460 [Cyclobacteriaceae bacterium]|nr:hypothetical protein [Cyclobacteriaceae bacterium]